MFAYNRMVFAFTKRKPGLYIIDKNRSDGEDNE